MHIRFFPPFRANKSTPCKRFHEILVVSPHVASYVKHLEILDGGTLLDTSGTWMASEESLWFVLSRLRLEKFSYLPAQPSGIFVHLLPEAAQASLRRIIHSPTLTSLTLRWLIFTPSSFHYMLHGATVLKELALFDVHVYNDDDNPNLKKKPKREPVANPIQLESFTAADSDGQVVELLLSPESPVDFRCLNTLVLSGQVSPHGPHLEDLVQRPRRTLKHLSIQNRRATSTDLALNTAQHDSLRSLYLESRGQPSWSNTFGNCSPYLEHLTLGFSLIDFSGITPDEWAELDEVLTRPLMTHLRSVVLKVHPGYLGEEWTRSTMSSFTECAESMSRYLPVLSARGLLEVESIPEYPRPSRPEISRQERGQSSGGRGLR